MTTSLHPHNCWCFVQTAVKSICRYEALCGDLEQVQRSKPSSPLLSAIQSELFELCTKVPLLYIYWPCRDQDATFFECLTVEQRFISGVWLNSACTSWHVELENMAIILTDLLGRLGVCLVLISLTVTACCSPVEWFGLVFTSTHESLICCIRLLLILMSACRRSTQL